MTQNYIDLSKMRREMLPTKDQVESCLEGLIVQIWADKNTTDLDKMGCVLRVFGRYGYDLKRYQDTYEQLKADISNGKLI